MSTPNNNGAQAQPAIGIDLGTSTSALALLQNGRPELLQDEQGERIIPSVIQLGMENQILVGSVAKHGAVTFHDRTAQEVKRLMGTDALVTLGDQTLTPEEVAAHLLRHLKAAAEAKLGPDTVRDVVISVPARFENAAREATKRAAELAGLNVLRLINEPTAAALSYGLDRLENNQKVLVFDFGGGTLDVTILEMFEGVLDVKTSVGDDRLGGKDVDDLIIAFFRDKFREQIGRDLPPPEEDRRAAQTLKEEAEDYKKQLSSAFSVMVDIPYLSSDGGISFMFNKTQFEDLLGDLLERAMALVDEALGRANLAYADIDVVLPVGGSSRLALFRRELERRWGKTLREYDNPDEAVAKGAAIAAGIELKQFDTESGIMILDVSPHRLGVSVLKQVGHDQYIDGYFSEIIPKDAKLPAIEKRCYNTIHNGNDTIEIQIFEATTGSTLCKDHRLISTLPLQNVPEVSAGKPVQVEFRYTLDGTLEVSAYCTSAPEIKVDGRFSLLGPTKTDRGAEEAMGMGIFDDIASALVHETEDAVTSTLNPGAYDRCAPLLEQADKIVRKKGKGSNYVKKNSESLRAALAEGSAAEIEKQLDALTDLLFELT